jgi:hypothetical protein
MTSCDRAVPTQHLSFRAGFVHPEPIASLGTLWERATIGPIPGQIVLLAGLVFHAATEPELRTFGLRWCDEPIPERRKRAKRCPLLWLSACSRSLLISLPESSCNFVQVYFQTWGQARRRWRLLCASVAVGMIDWRKSWDTVVHSTLQTGHQVGTLLRSSNGQKAAAARRRCCRWQSR